MNEPSVFTKIIGGDIPSYKIYEDSKTLAFLDINPVAEGHVLVVPKTQVEFVWDLTDEDYQALMATVKKVAVRLRTVIAKPFVGEMVVGTDVPHAHVHIIAFTKVTEMKRVLGEPGAPADAASLRAVAEKLYFL
ncbi:HIT family protein [Candidatus Saccharibacteria bacterium]|nr:HIT family protein [Candidatus Saccharibacteria bacterium]